MTANTNMPTFVVQSTIARKWQAVFAVIITIKDPNADENFILDWTAPLNGDTIQTSMWDIPLGLSSSRQAIINSNTGTQTGLAGGQLGQTYFMTNLVTLKTSGQTLVQNFEVTIQSV